MGLIFQYLETLPHMLNTYFAFLAQQRKLPFGRKMDNTANAHQQMIGVALMKCLRWKTLASVPECHREVRSIEENFACVN